MNEQDYSSKTLKIITNALEGDFESNTYVEDMEQKGIFCYKDEGRTVEMLSYPQIVQMLQQYDDSRIIPFEKAYGYEDSRVHTFNFQQFKKYLGHIEGLSKKSGISISGISFIYGAKDCDGAKQGYNSLLYLPSTIFNGQEVLFDPVQSAKRMKLVTFREMLEEYGYQWIYDTAEDYEHGKRKDNNYDLKSNQVKSTTFSIISNDDFGQGDQSGTGNLSHFKPPYRN
ncbi:MAG: hypothetical protein HRT67_06195 [Flavobacteriaceae bacterium]|nr:hypothetical protein [Flavobacteriaceae bacterium]